jgi:hypothetical protein
MLVLLMEEIYDNAVQMNSAGMIYIVSSKFHDDRLRHLNNLKVIVVRF